MNFEAFKEFMVGLLLKITRLQSFTVIIYKYSAPLRYFKYLTLNS